jgi:hypothetical protein
VALWAGQTALCTFNYSVNPFVVNGAVETTLRVDGNITTDVNFNASSLVLTLAAARSESPDPFNGPEFQVISGQPFTSVIGVQSSDPIADARNLMPFATATRPFG